MASQAAVTHRCLMLTKILAGFLMAICVGLSFGIFWIRDFDEEFFNKTKHNRLMIKVNSTSGVWGSWMSVWAFHSLMISWIVQLDTKKIYTKTRWGRFLDIVVLASTMISAIISGIMLLYFVRSACTKRQAISVIKDFEKNPNEHIIKAGSSYKFFFEFVDTNTNQYNQAKVKIRDAPAVMDAILEYCFSGIHQEVIFLAGTFEILSACLLLLAIVLAFGAEDYPSKANEETAVEVEEEEEFFHSEQIKVTKLKQAPSDQGDEKTVAVSTSTNQSDWESADTTLSIYKQVE